MDVCGPNSGASDDYRCPTGLLFMKKKRAKRERGLLQVYILDEVGLEILEEERERRLPAGGDFSSPPRFVIKVKTKCFSAFRSLFFV